VTVTLVPVFPNYQATAVAAFSDGSSREVTIDAQWTSSNPSVATVSSGGRVTPVAVGSTEIRATYQGVSGGASLTVAQPPVLVPNYSVSGTIRDGLDRAAVFGVVVTVLPEGQTSPPAAVTSSSGTYEITGSWVGNPPFNATITARRDGYGTETVQRVVSTEATVDFTLNPLPFTLYGTVQDAENRDSPFCETRVQAIDGPNAGRFIVVPRPGDGSYQFPDLLPGTFTVRAYANGYYMRETTARLRGFEPLNRLNFVLPRGAPPPSGGGRVDCNAPLL
jgi:hypothetical protein